MTKFVACAMALVAVLFLSSPAHAQQPGGSQIRNCVVQVIASDRESCAALAFLQAQAPHVPACQVFADPVATAAPLFCGTCQVRTGRVIPGCEAYLTALPPPVVQPDMDAGAPTADAATPWNTPEATPDAGVLDRAPPSDVVAVNDADAAPEATAMDAAVESSADAGVDVATDAGIDVDVPCPPSDGGAGHGHGSASTRCVNQNIRGVSIPDGAAVVVLPAGDAAVNGTIVLTAEQICRASGGFWDGESDIPMERGRIQHGFCFSVEMQAYARAQEGRGDDMSAADLLRAMRNRRDGFVRESRLQEVTGGIADAGAQAIANERADRELQVGALNDNQSALSARLDRQEELEQGTRDTLERLRLTGGFEASLYGGGSLAMVHGPQPAYVGVLLRGHIPLRPRLTFTVGVGFGAGFPFDERGQGFQYGLLQTLGVTYFVVGEERHRLRNGREALSFAPHTLTLGAGLLGAELVSGLDFAPHAVTLGLYAEIGYAYRVNRHVELTLSAIGAFGQGYRWSTQWTGGFFPDGLLLGTFGLRAHF